MRWSDNNDTDMAFNGICSNPLCRNSNDDGFLTRHVFSEDEEYEVISCKCCQCEIATNNVTEAPLEPLDSCHVKNDTVHNEAQRAQEQEDSQDGGGHVWAKETHETNTRQIYDRPLLKIYDASCRKTISGPTIEEDYFKSQSPSAEELPCSGMPSPKTSALCPPDLFHIPKSYDDIEQFSLDGINDVLSFAPCQACGSPKEALKDHKDLTIAWYCKQCHDCSGVDDTFTIPQALSMACLLAEALETAQLWLEPCRTPDCGNMDPDLFRFHWEDGQTVIKCDFCGRTVDESEENDSDGKDASGIICTCGNDEADQFDITEDASGTIINVRCCSCQHEFDTATFTEDDELESDPDDNVSENNEGLVGNNQRRDDENDEPHDDDPTPSCYSGHENKSNSPITCNQGPQNFKPAKKRTRVWDDLSILKPGDHIFWDRIYALWHHAIVEEVVDNVLHVIHYNGYFNLLDKLRGRPVKLIDVGVFREAIKDWNSDPLFRMDYTDCYPPEKVLENARKRVMERKFNPFKRNCEHFAQWCKIGTCGSKQVKQFKQYLGLKSTDIASVAVRDGIKMTRHLAANAAEKSKLLAKMGAGVAKKALRTIGKAEVITGGVVVGMEMIRTGIDVYRLYKDKKEGAIDHTEFVRCTIKRVVRGIGGVAGSLVGGFIGSFIPIPIVGTLLGGTVGGFLGEWVGKMVGRAIGNKASSKKP